MGNHLRMSEEQLATHNAKVSAGRAGGNARAKALTPDRRSAIASRAGTAAAGKYKARREYFDRIWFASGAELERYKLLRIAERAGAIVDLVVHPAFPLIVDGVTIGTYRADFRYINRSFTTQVLPGHEVVEDVKSPATAMKETFRRTIKHVRSQYHIDVQVVIL